MMSTLQQAFQVSFQYPVCFTTDLFNLRNHLLAELVAQQGRHPGPRMICIIDAGVAQAHPQLATAITTYCQHHRSSVTLVCPALIIAGGEQAKNDPTHVAAIHAAINTYGIDRHAYVLAIGGGALIDMVGYAAATAHRGVRLIRVPTTVLAQNDAAVGVKNSINAFGKKNFLGTFAPPYAVLNDSSFLTTLTDRDWRSGIAEAIKVALLKDAAFFNFIEQHTSHLVQRDSAAMRHVIYRCAELHLAHIASGDPFEQGSARPLDFGHWAAHKLEALTGYELRHGEAVAIGIALDSTYAHLIGLLAEADWRRIIGVLADLGFAIHVPQLSERCYPSERLAILDGLNEFREHLGGQLTITLLTAIGHSMEVHTMDETAIIRAIKILHQYQSQRALPHH